MNEQHFDPYTGQPVNAPVQTATGSAPAKAQKPARVFSSKEKIFAWLSVVIGYLFCRTFWIWNNTFIGLIFTVCLFAFAFFFFGRNKRRIRSYFYPASALILASALFFTGSEILRFFVFSYILIAFLLFCQTGSAEALENRAGALYVFESVKAVFVSPFKNLLASFFAIGSDKGGKKIGKTLLVILAGVGLALLPTVIVIGLLSFDRNFTDVLDRIRQTLFDEIFTRVWSLIFGVPIGMYVYGALYSAAHPNRDAFNAENCTAIENKVKFAPALAGIIAILPLLFLYGIYVYVQKDYYGAIFSGSLPDAYTFAEFAKDGFFRLCVAAGLNAFLLILLRIFTKKSKSGKISPAVRIVTAILSLFTIVISCTAISQMLMYVSAYGLTRLRLYTLWFMALLVIFFFITILKQCFSRLPFAAATLTVFVIAFGLLAIPDTDAIIAEHNCRCYLTGTTKELDVEYIGSLGDSGVPALCDIAESGNYPENLRLSAYKQLGAYFANDKKTTLYNLNLPALKAKAATDALSAETRRKAAVAENAALPYLYLSQETVSVQNGSRTYSVSVYQYDKRDESVFTENEQYRPVSEESLESDRKALDYYKRIFQNVGRLDEMPLFPEEINSGGRWLINQYRNTCVYDRNEGKLYVFDNYGD